VHSALKEAVDNIRGAVMICYPMGLPEWDLIRMLLEDREGDACSQVCVRMFFWYVCVMVKSRLYRTKRNACNWLHLVLFCSSSMSSPKKCQLKH
jgi:hypothetical protein